MATKSPVAAKGLNRDVLSATALQILDAHGLAALSMRRLASELGVDPMAAYRHLPNKDALLDAVLDRVLRDVDLPSHTDSPWNLRLRAGVKALMETLLRHPRAAPLLAERTWTTPYGLAVSEWFMRTLVEAGIPARDAFLATNTTGLFLVSLANAIHGATLAPPAARLAGLIAGEAPVIAQTLAAGQGATYEEMLDWWLDRVEEGLRRT